MATSGYRQPYVIISAMILVVGGVVAIVWSNMHRSEAGDVPGVLGVQSGSVSDQAARTNGTANLSQSATSTRSDSGPGTDVQSAAPYGLRSTAGRRSGGPTAPAPSTPTSSTIATLPTGGYGNADDIGYKENPLNESVASAPVPAGVPTPVVPYIVGRHAIEILIGSTEPWADLFKTSDDSPVTWQPDLGGPIYWEGTSIGSPSSPAYMILSGDPNVASVSLLYKVIVNDVVAKPGDTIIFTLYAAEIDQVVQLQVTIVE